MGRKVSEDLTLESATELVEKLQLDPASWKAYEYRTEAEKLAMGVVILNKVLNGKSLRTIEAETGIPKSTVSRYRDRALQTVAAPVADEARKVELERLDTLIEAVWATAASGDEKAIAAYLKLSDKRCALLGLNAPVKVEQTVTEISAQERELQDLIAQAERDDAMKLAKEIETL